MYTEKEYAEARSALIWFIALYCVLAAVLLGAIVAAVIFRLEWLAYVAAGILAVATLFLWGNFGVRLVAWNRFLKDIETGLEHSAEGVIDSIDEDIAVKEGLEFRALRLMTGEETDKAGGRLIYVDASRFPLKAGIGQKVRCMLFGNYIKEIIVSEDE